MSRRQRRGADEIRFTRLMAEVAPELLAYFHRRADIDSADLLADLMTTAWRRYADLPGDHEEARMWLFGIARNVLNNNIRSAVRRRRLADALRGKVVAAQEMDTSERLAIRDLIARLEPELAEVVTLHHWEGLTLAEISVIQQVSASAVRGRYQRAKQSLRDSLSTMGEDVNTG